MLQPETDLTQNGHSRSFKVVYFGIIEEPLMGYIAQYNKCGLRCIVVINVRKKIKKTLKNAFFILKIKKRL